MRYVGRPVGHVRLETFLAPGHEPASDGDLRPHGQPFPALDPDRRRLLFVTLHHMRTSQTLAVPTLNLFPRGASFFHSPRLHPSPLRGPTIDPSIRSPRPRRFWDPRTCLCRPRTTRPPVFHTLLLLHRRILSLRRQLPLGSGYPLLHAHRIECVTSFVCTSTPCTVSARSAGMLQVRR